MPKLVIGEADIYYEEAGQGPPLLLVPGLSGLGAFWTHQVAEFKRDFRVIIHDHRGAGQSTHSRIRYSVEQMADDVLRLMDRLGIAAAHLVGHSTGGAIGQVIAQDHPGRLQSLVLSATWAGRDPFFRRLFESRKEILLKLGVEAYLRASVLFLAPPWWVSANDAAISPCMDAYGVHGHRRQNDAAFDGALPVRAESEKRQRRSDDAEEQQAEHSADDGAASS